MGMSLAWVSAAAWAVPAVGNRCQMSFQAPATIAASMAMDHAKTPEIRLETVASNDCQARKPLPETRKRLPATDAGTAIDVFCSDIEDQWAGDCMPLTEIMDQYARMRKQRHILGGVVTTKAMVSRLKARGWTRVQLDLRDQGLGRPVCYVVPERTEREAA